jgi:hypothetical protein
MRTSWVRVAGWIFTVALSIAACVSPRGPSALRCGEEGRLAEVLESLVNKHATEAQVRDALGEPTVRLNGDSVPDAASAERSPSWGYGKRPVLRVVIKFDRPAGNIVSAEMAVPSGSPMGNAEDAARCVGVDLARMERRGPERVGHTFGDELIYLDSRKVLEIRVSESRGEVRGLVWGPPRKAR